MLHRKMNVVSFKGKVLRRFFVYDVLKNVGTVLLINNPVSGVNTYPCFGVNLRSVFSAVLNAVCRMTDSLSLS